ncbi:DUF1702 family protein [Actinoplanes rectilineatus]|uniref:DUF1702 family protein n=1 Tax=Actinoplanes rectilineatus TaxID=113571 RepID=UPI0005F28683|nr:DUF1702 family protein [Actinoplanes rectilineatus]
MPPLLGTLRRLALAPALHEVSFAHRGFPVTPTPATRRLEAVPEAVVCGFEWGIETRGQAELVRRLELVEPEMRGFAYEGATMAYTVRDAMAGGRGGRARELLSGPAVPHTFLTYIGIGFAMARLPRVLWRGVLPDLTGTPYHPTMSWLAVDGYGFDLAYFHTGRYVDEQRVPASYPWQGRPDYFPRAVDQGVGRALWFIHGGNAPAVGAAVGRFAVDRRPDLWSGVGLAATFAGGTDAAGLAALCRIAAEQGDHLPHLAQGAVFAAKARAFSGFTPPHTGVATGALAGLSAEAAARLADEVAGAGEQPEYEKWRGLIRDRFPGA